MDNDKPKVKITIDGSQLEGCVIHDITYSPFTVIDETHDLKAIKEITEMEVNIDFDVVYDPLEIERLKAMSSRAITGNNYERTKPFKTGVKPLHWTFNQEPNGKGMNRAMYRTGMKWSEEYKETKRRVKHIALPHRIRRTVLHFMAKVRRSLRGDKGLLSS